MLTLDHRHDQRIDGAMNGIVKRVLINDRLHNVVCVVVEQNGTNDRLFQLNIVGNLVKSPLVEIGDISYRHVASHWSWVVSVMPSEPAAPGAFLLSSGKNLSRHID